VQVDIRQFFLAFVFLVAIILLCAIFSNTTPSRASVLPLLRKTKFRTRTTDEVIVLNVCIIMFVDRKYEAGCVWTEWQQAVLECKLLLL
jgi:hypothetical protein